jgi:hypothetical protein
LWWAILSETGQTYKAEQGRAIRAQHLVFDGQIVGLAGTNEAEAGEAVLRLLGQEARLVLGAGIRHGAGSSAVAWSGRVRP